MTPDFINGCFEFFASIFIFIHCLKLQHDKLVRGVSIISTVFFLSWGFWNIFYYPKLGQMFSFYMGLLVCAVNMVYVGMMIYYVNLENEMTALKRARLLKLSFTGYLFEVVKYNAIVALLKVYGQIKTWCIIDKTDQLKYRSFEKHDVFLDNNYFCRHFNCHWIASVILDKHGWGKIKHDILSGPNEKYEVVFSSNRFDIEWIHAFSSAATGEDFLNAFFRLQKYVMEEDIVEVLGHEQYLIFKSTNIEYLHKHI